MPLDHDNPWRPHNWPRWLRRSVGMLLLVVGLAGLLLPIMPGWIFIFPGMFLLGEETRLSRWFHRCLHRLRKHGPPVSRD